MSDPETEMFPPTNGQVTGVAGILLALVAAGYSLTVLDQRYGPEVLALAVLIAVLTYAGVIRPRVGLSEEHLVFRQMFSTLHLPLAAIQDVSVRHVTVVRVAGRKYDSPALSRTRPRRRERREPGPTHLTVSQHLEQRIDRAMALARQRAGVEPWSEEQAALAGGVREEWCWPLVALTLVILVGVVAAIAV